MAEDKAEKKKGKPAITSKDVEEAFEELKEEAGDESNLIFNEDEGKYDLVQIDGKKMRRLCKPMSAAQFLKCCKFATRVLKATASD